MKRVFTPCPTVVLQRVESCGCIVTENPGHVHTKLCDQHKREHFKETRDQAEANNLDLVGG